MKPERLTYYRRLANRGNPNAQRVVDAFDPDQPRGPDGKWESGGSIGTTKSGKSIEAPARMSSFMGGGGGVATPLGPSRAIEHVRSTSAGYSKQDHYDAHHALLALAKEARGKGDHDRAYHLGAVASAHKLTAQGKL